MQQTDIGIGFLGVFVGLVFIIIVGAIIVFLNRGSNKHKQT